jgi:O-antigen/teichoic acid export membrane protein
MIVFFTVYLNVMLNILRLKEKVITYGLISCSSAALSFILSIIFVKTFNLGWEGRVYAQMICCFIYGSSCIVILLKKKFFALPDIAVWKQMLAFGVPLIPHLATNFIRQGCDRYIINYYYSIEDVGIFSFALNLVNIITMVGFGFNQSNSVSIYKILGNTELEVEYKYATTIKSIKRYFSMYVMITIIVVAVCRLLIPLLLPQYTSSMPYFFILSLYGLGVCEYLVYTNFLFYFKKTKQLMYITFGSSVLHLFLSFILTRYSLLFTSIIYFLSQLVVVLLVRKMALFWLNRSLKNI